MSGELHVEQSQTRIDVSVINTHAWTGGFNLLDPKAVLQASETDLVDLAKQIEVADKFTHANASNKLSMILDQIRYLQQKAREVLADSHRDAALHHLSCNFKKVPGATYHLYERPTGQLYFSMLSPQDWGLAPHKFVGSYFLEHDMSWSKLENVAARSKQYDLIDKLLAANKAIDDRPEITLALKLPALDQCETEFS